MNILNSANLLMKGLLKFNPVLNVASTGSCYIKLTGANVSTIRVANHTGHNSYSSWQLRSDVSSSRKGKARIFNCVNRLLNQVKSK